MVDRFRMPAVEARDIYDRFEYSLDDVYQRRDPEEFL